MIKRLFPLIISALAITSCSGSDDEPADGGNTGNTGSGDNNTDKPGKDDSTKSPQTGDSSNLIGWLAALFVGGGVLTLLGVSGKKRKESEAE